MPYRPDRLLIERRVLDLPLTRRVIARLPHLTPEIIETPGRIPSAPRGGAREIYTAAKRTLIVGLSPGLPLRTCRPSADYELPLGSSCPGFCQYCYLQGSLGARPYVRVYADLNAIEAAVEERLAAEPGEVSFEAASTSDPIAVEHLTGALAELIPFFGRLDRARLRVVTKFAYTEGLIGLPHGGRTRIRYSLNTGYVHSFEAGTDSIEKRIEAANRLGRDGYPIGFVLAPLMIYQGWEHDYEALLAGLAERLDPALLPGLTFELISYRFTARAKEVIRARFPLCRLDLDETRRRIKWGRYGHRKFVYPAEDLQKLWRRIEEAIERYFPGAVVEYAT